MRDGIDRRRRGIGLWGHGAAALAVALLLGAGAARAADDVAAEPSPFEKPEPVVTPAPAAAATLALARDETLLAFDVAPTRPEAALAVRDGNGAALRIWTIGGSAAPRGWRLPAGSMPEAIAWHPEGTEIFLLVREQAGHAILAQDPAAPTWAPRRVHRSRAALRRLVAGPRPFGGAYRLFFGETRGNGLVVRSITVGGEKPYTAIAPQGAPRPGDDPEAPEPQVAASAEPLGFHPAGHILLWRDAKGCVQRLTYDRDAWGQTAPALAGKESCEGELGFTPNGAALLRWSAAGGTRLIEDRGAAERALAGIDATAPPRPTADGRGLVFPAADGLRYQPLELPLADVVNAWMFLETPDDRQRFMRDRGLLRPLDVEQLYSLYESELYYCRGYDQASPARPYLVTTDLFWEVYGAAFEGLMVLVEQRRTLPAFWRFAAAARDALHAAAPEAKTARAFAAVMALRDGSDNAEAARIRAAAGRARSDVAGIELDFTTFKPRSHYAASPALAAYFAAVRYLLELPLDDADRQVLAALPAPVQVLARDWIAGLSAFIAGPRAPLVWDPAVTPAGFARRPQPATLFPRGWGLDNEALDAGILHRDLPPAEQVDRLLPSGLDVATVLGSTEARRRLRDGGAFGRHAGLEAALDRAIARARAAGRPADTLYQHWLDALAVQWADPPAGAPDSFGGSLWATKRLQTGLASWATLRHATLLVNETTGAECGEGGYELIEMRPPRGFVEPDPAAFEAIAGLFDATRRWLETDRGTWDGSGTPELKAGILRRLAESGEAARRFAGIARKQAAGSERSPAEYDAILQVARAAEHNFLVFKSLAAPDFALINPEPVMKIAEIADTAGTRQFAAVGRPLEWDQVVPFFGRRQIVKGAVYAYHEFSGPAPLTDAEWRAMPMTPPDWVAPLIASTPLSCPPLTP